jgi:hypothetical protein
MPGGRTYMSRLVWICVAPYRPVNQQHYYNNR